MKSQDPKAVAHGHDENNCWPQNLCGACRTVKAEARVQELERRIYVEDIGEGRITVGGHTFINESTHRAICSQQEREVARLKGEAKCDIDHEALWRELRDKNLLPGECPGCGAIILGS